YRFRRRPLGHLRRAVDAPGEGRLPRHVHCAEIRQAETGAHPAGVPNQYLAGVQLKPVWSESTRSASAAPSHFCGPSECGSPTILVLPTSSQLRAPLSFWSPPATAVGRPVCHVRWLQLQPPDTRHPLYTNLVG